MVDQQNNWFIIIFVKIWVAILFATELRIVSRYWFKRRTQTGRNWITIRHIITELDWLFFGQECPDRNGVRSVKVNLESNFVVSTLFWVRIKCNFLSFKLMNFQLSLSCLPPMKDEVPLSLLQQLSFQPFVSYFFRVIAFFAFPQLNSYS